MTQHGQLLPLEARRRIRALEKDQQIADERHSQTLALIGDRVKEVQSCCPHKSILRIDDEHECTDCGKELTL